MSQQDRRIWALRAFDFVRSIGLNIREATSAAETANCFAPHVKIEHGQLIVDLDLVFPGCILHESGHLATLPAMFRPLCSGRLAAVQTALSEYLDANPFGLAMYPEDPVCRAIMQAGDAEVTAWQYAAAQEIGLPDEWIFIDGSYDGTAPDVLRALKARSYIGIHGLRAAGWTALREAHSNGGPVFPKLAHWLCPAVPMAPADQ